ncbi:class I SAM-dependent methyltransferase [Bradyrhizobium lablabi]|nr:class I SAM-dependent methyltransferase [Bradyrhizobium lablabi]
MGKCRFCDAPLSETFVDLGMMPLSNSFVPPERCLAPDMTLPLHALVCEACWLVQIPEFESPENIFSDYLYFSSYSDLWLKHSAAYCQQMIERFGIGQASMVVEIASNDGYLLKNFVHRGIPALGIEPAANVAEVARSQGVPTEILFFGVDTARSLSANGISADLMTANNVLAHVPDINDFVAGFRILLKPEGVATFEFPSLERLISERQFDTIYHEHFSYLSLLVVSRIFQAHGLRVFDIESLPTHGGSLRVYVCRNEARHAPTARVDQQFRTELDAGLERIGTYRAFARSVVEAKIDLLSFFVNAHRAGKRVVGYGAPAKANTLLNFCGIGPELLEFTVDRSPHKQGRLMPGSRIPIRAPDKIFEVRPDYVLILPWNLQSEIVQSLAGIREWGGRFVVPIPSARILP